MPDSEKLLRQFDELRREHELLAAGYEQLRHAVAQLSRENESHQRRLNQASYGKSRRQRLLNYLRTLHKRFRGKVRTTGPVPSAAAKLHRDVPSLVVSAAALPMPRVCFFGEGISGSWMMRGQQIASMRSEWITKTRFLPVWNAQGPPYDVFCFVKRLDAPLARRLRSHGIRVVYDVIDPWKQPEDDEQYTTPAAIVEFFRQRLSDLPLDGVIFPNAAMQEDLGRFVPNPVTIYHHAHLGFAPIQVRRHAEVLAYEGDARFLGHWRLIIERICARRGLRFVINPPTLADADIGIAVRGGRHGSLLARRYKSNVKLANFYTAGLPCVVHGEECAYRETANGDVRFFVNQEDLEQAIVALLPYEARRRIHVSFLEESKKFRLEEIAQQYETYFRRLLGQELPVATYAAA